MNLLNKIVSSIFNILFLPFEKIDPVWGMLALSFVTGIVMLFIFKATSDQKGIKRAKNLVKGHFLAIRLYKDDISLMLDTLKNILTSNLLYMKKSLRPMLFLLIPVALILIQLGVRYEFRPLRVGETTVVSAQMGRDVVLSNVEFNLPPGLVLEAPPVRAMQKQQISWRIRAEKPGTYTLAFTYGDKTETKQLAVVDELIPVNAEIANDDLGITLMNPNEQSLPAASFASLISIEYPTRDFTMWGFSVHWLLAFFVISLVAAFAFKGFLGVEV